MITINLLRKPVFHPATPDDTRVRMIDHYLANGQMVKALLLSRKIADPQRRFQVQMAKLVEPLIYSDNARVSTELLCDDFVLYARTLPKKERAELLALIANKLAKIDGGSNELTPEINAILRKAATVTIGDLFSMREEKITEAIGLISGQWGNFSLTPHYPPLIGWLRLFLKT